MFGIDRHSVFRCTSVVGRLATASSVPRRGREPSKLRLRRRSTLPAQRRQNILSRRMPCGSQSPEKSHDSAKMTVARIDRGVMRKANTTSLNVTWFDVPVVMPLKGSMSNNPDNRAQQRQHQRLEHKRRQDARPAEADHTQGRDFAAAIRDRRIHRIHGREDRTDSHDEPHHLTNDLDGTAGTGLLGVSSRSPACHRVSTADHRTDGVLQGSAGRWIRRTQICRCKRALAIEIRCHLVHVAPDFRLVRATARVEDAHHFPRTLAELQSCRRRWSWRSAC